MWNEVEKEVIAAIASTLCFAAMMSLTAYASGDVAGVGHKHLEHSQIANSVGVNNVFSVP